jgi:hypothetical protein
MMLSEPSFVLHGTRYLVVRHGPFAGDGRGRTLAEPIAARILYQLLREEPWTARLLYAQLSDQGSLVRVDDQTILAWFSRELSTDQRLCIVEVVPNALGRAEAALELGVAQEARRIDSLLAVLGRSDLLHRGRSYRLVRAVMQRTIENRSRCEVMGREEARAVLSALAQDPVWTQHQRHALEQLLSVMTNQADKPWLELLLLRRLRSAPIASGEGPALTPSQLRKSREVHWIEVELVDRHTEQPKAGVSLELVLADGELRKLRSDDLGLVRVSPIPVGDVTIRLPELDGEMWTPVGGAPARQAAQASRYTTYRVRMGDSLSRIARRHGLAGWKKLWDDARNEPLRKLRKSPHVLRPGDQVMVPSASAFELVRATDATHRIAIITPRVELKVIVGDHHGRPYKNQPYQLRLTRGSEAGALSGTTDASGQVIEQVPASLVTAFIHLTELDVTWPVEIRSLHPLPDELEEALDARGLPNQELTRAVQERLGALGIAAGPMSGVWNEATRLALQQLRRARGSHSAEPLCAADVEALRSYGV